MAAYPNVIHQRYVRSMLFIRQSCGKYYYIKENNIKNEASELTETSLNKESMDNFIFLISILNK